MGSWKKFERVLHDTLRVDLAHLDIPLVDFGEIQNLVDQVVHSLGVLDHKIEVAA